jgi:Mrp family chromosome partitioning ATPase
LDATREDPATPEESGLEQPHRAGPPVRGLGIQLDRIRRHVWLVTAIVLVSAIAAGAAAVSSKSTFTAQAVLSVASKTRAPTEDAALAQGYVLFFNESNYRDQLAERAKVGDDVSAIGAQTAGLSPVFYITATSTSRDTAQGAASAIAQAFADEINARLAVQRDASVAAMTDNLHAAYQDRTDPEALAAQTQLQQQIDQLNSDTANQVTVLEPAAGVTEEGSGALETVAMLLIGGLLVGCAAAIAVGINSKRLDTDYDVAEKLGIEPLDVLPSPSDTRHSAVHAVRVQHLLNVIVRTQSARPAAVTVAPASEGDSARELAAAMAQQRAAQGVQTVLVDANIRAGDDRTAPGLAELLSSDPVEIESVVETRSEKLEVIGPGRHNGDPYELFDRDRFSHLVERLLERADFVVVAAPALARAGEAQVISDVTQSVLLVIDAGTRLEDAREAARVLDQVDATLVGTVLVERSGRLRMSKSSPNKSN